VDKKFPDLDRFADTPKKHAYDAAAEDEFRTLVKDAR
jgi:hypothetical protein